jgi:hypothetical protein
MALTDTAVMALMMALMMVLMALTDTAMMNDGIN